MMTFYAAGSVRGGCATARVLLSTYVLVLCLSAAGCAGEATATAPPTVTLRTLITGTCEEIHRYAESVVGTSVIQSTVERAVLFLESFLGQENLYTAGMFVGTVIRFLAEGAASGLNVIAVYVTEILRVTGVDVPLSFPRFTPEGVTSVAQWGLLALIGYWLLTVVLRLAIGVLRQVFWVLKTVVALWLFGLIVSDAGASADLTAMRLASLVFSYVLLGLGTSSGSEKTVTLEKRLKGLERRLEEVEGKE